MIEPGFYLIDSRGYYLAKEFVSSITNKPDCTMTNTLNHVKCYQDAEEAQALADELGLEMMRISEVYY